MSDKPRILFVDDEPNIVQGLKRLLYSLRNEWDMFFVTSGNDALNLLDKTEVDIIVTDMKMPEMDGGTLLNIVKEKYPEVIRIVLSGYSEKELILKSVRSIHQFIAKPCDADTFKITIANIVLLRKYLDNGKLKALVTGVDNLPCLPELYLELENEISSIDPSIRRVSDIISKDIVMSAKILQLANSAFFGLPHNINSIGQAINFLGMEIIKSLVLLVKLFPSTDLSKIKFNLHDFWSHSLKVARLSQEIMKAESFDRGLCDIAFISGLLHDIGKLVLIQSPEYLEKVTKLMESECLMFIDAEYKIYEASHAEVGAYLLGLWGLPQTILETAAFHHKPSVLNDNRFGIITAIHIANYLVNNSNLDSDYINSMSLEDKLTVYQKIYERLNDEQKSSFGR